LFNLRDVVRREKSLSALGGNETIASQYHFTLFPQARFLGFGAFLHIGLPLRFPIYDNGEISGRGIRSAGCFKASCAFVARTQDFRSAWDAQRALRHLAFKTENNTFMLRLSRSHTITFDKGELLNNLSPEALLYDHDPLFLALKARLD